MASPVLVGIDPRDLERAPLEFGARLHVATGAPLILAGVYLYQGGLSSVPSWEPPALDTTRILRAVAAGLSDRGIAADICTVGRPNAALGLRDLAEEVSAGLIVVGETHRGRIGSVIPGSTAERLAEARCALAVVGADYAVGPLNRIGVAFTPTPEGRRALAGAALLARALRARLHVVAVHEPAVPIFAAPMSATPTVLTERGVAAGELATAVQGLPADIGVTSQLLDGDPVTELAAISGKVDLLVCGSRGRGPIAGAVLGSVTRRLSRETLCPLVIEPRGTTAGLASLVRATPLAEASS